MLFKIVLFCLFSVSVIFGQTFKEVNTAQDVIDNYIAAIGGADGLKKVKSISMQGTIEGAGDSGTLKVYYSRDYFYMDLKTSVIHLKQAIDFKNNKGWSMFGDKVKDMSQKDITGNLMNIDESMWSYYLYPEKNGIEYELYQNKKVNGNEAYVVGFKSDGSVVETSYHDTITFYILKQVKVKDISEFSDYREVGTSKVRMPYYIRNQAGIVKISEIKFNEIFDKKFLNKPEDEH